MCFLHKKRNKPMVGRDSPENGAVRTEAVHAGLKRKSVCWSWFLASLMTLSMSVQVSYSWWHSQWHRVGEEKRVTLTSWVWKCCLFLLRYFCQVSPEHCTAEAWSRTSVPGMRRKIIGLGQALKPIWCLLMIVPSHYSGVTQCSKCLGRGRIACV